MGLVCQTHSKAGCHKHHHQIEGCHLLGNDGFHSQCAQIMLDLPMTAFTILWMTLYQWITAHFFDRYMLVRKQGVARWQGHYERIAPCDLRNDAIGLIESLGKPSVIQAIT